jgi:hypothetical protein
MLQHWHEDPAFLRFREGSRPDDSLPQQAADASADNRTTQPMLERWLRDAETARLEVSATKQLPMLVGTVAQLRRELRILEAYEQHVRKTRKTAPNALAVATDLIARFSSDWLPLPEAVLVGLLGWLGRRSRKLMACVSVEFLDACRSGHAQRRFEYRPSGFVPFALAMWEHVRGLVPGHQEVAGRRVRVLERAWFGLKSSSYRARFLAFDTPADDLPFDARTQAIVHEILRHSERAVWAPSNDLGWKIPGSRDLWFEEGRRAVESAVAKAESQLIKTNC